MTDTEKPIVETAIAYKGPLRKAIQAMGNDWARDYLENRASVSPEEVLDTIAKGSKQGNRACLAIYAEIMGWAVRGAEVVVAIWKRLGVRDELEARSRISMAADVEGLSQEDTFRVCCEFVDEYCRQQGLTMTFPRSGAEVVE